MLRIPASNREVGRIAQAFQPPLLFDWVRMAGFYDDDGFCEDCGVPYCARHWHVSETGYGHCPIDHGTSLDPRWQPAEEDRAMPGEELAGRLYGLLIGMGDRLAGLYVRRCVRSQKES